MRIASFNVENLFSRAIAMNFESISQGKQILDDYSKLNGLLLKANYTQTVKEDILKTLTSLGLSKKDESDYVILRQNRSKLLKRSRSGEMPEVIADGRTDWVGWLELKTEAVNELATRMTAKVIKDVGADILAVVEAEDRIALVRFNNQLLKPLNGDYSEIMLIDGNDERGIDVGLMTKNSLHITSMTSHINDRRDEETIFSRDCPEYTVAIDNSTSILVLVNHFKSKGYGSQASSDARRLLQAQRVREIYDQRRSEGIELIAIVGDLNDTPESKPMEPLLGNDSELRDISVHPEFVSDGRSGTYGNGTDKDKIDYLLLSPKLFEKVTAGGVFRKGVWGGTKGTLFPHYPEMTQAADGASDHAAIWADLDL
jgi:endonuclease/exonuclease/phosphatase family metal-dependent hydrolase